MIKRKKTLKVLEMKGFGEHKKSKKKSNKKIKLSKEQIISKAIQFHQKGNVPEAKKYYQYCINQGFNDHIVFSNYGIILKNLGKLEEAEKSYRKAIEIKPDFAKAHSNLGNILKNLGKLEEAEKSYRKAIEIKPDFAQANSNLGNILKDLGKLEEAEESYRKAIKIKPDFADAHYNLGNIFSDLGKLEEAEKSYRKAIKIKPDFAQANSNLGNIFKDLGKSQEAFDCYLKAIKLNPNYANAYLNLGNIFSDLGKSKEAFDCYLKAIDINPKNSNAYNLLTIFLKNSDLSQLNESKLKYIINILLEKNDISHRELFNAFNFIYGSEIISSLEKFDSDFSVIELLINNKVIINQLKKIIFRDLKLEKILTKVRKNICNRIAKNIENINYSQLQFIIALGEQCFFNEYIYSLTEEENSSLNIIIKRCKDSELNEKNISILSCYFPLYKLLDKFPSLTSFKSTNQSFKELVELQIKEPLKEIELSKDIKKLGSINDDVSKKVKCQYEENPYPRWRYSSDHKNQELSIIQAINNEINPNYIRQRTHNNELKVLIAGCGTGNQILQAQRYKNAQITAIDLSLSSLSYAQRKINELKIDNVELIQMDILEVGLLKEQFDIIECSGVLHHMNKPSEGLKTLLRVLRNNGYLKLGLYSELARQEVIKARNYIWSNKLQTNEDNIRNFRQKIISGELSELKSFQSMGDFYSLSEFRDLCFHAAEQRFTINQLEETLKSNKLKFLGFLLPKQVKSIYKQYFPEDKKQINLQNWASIEEKDPNTFKEMYQFWVSKSE